MVLLKRISVSAYAEEVAIGQYLNSTPLSGDPRNHTCPFLEVLQDPIDTDIRIIVMPFLRRYRNPTFQTVGEAVEFFRQAFEVCLSICFKRCNLMGLPAGPLLHA